MSATNTLVGGLIGYAIAFPVIAVVMGRDMSRWIKRAHKLAAQSDIALPGLLAGRVARFLRNEYLLSQLVLVPTVPLFSAAYVAGDAYPHQDWTEWFPRILAGLPLYLIVMFFAISRWPRWKASGDHRVSHLGSLPIRQAFTSAEYTAVVSGVVLSAALGALGLRYVAAPAAWWLVCAAILAAAFAAWRYAAVSLMNRPSSASDAIELAWDDMLRFRRVRGFTAAAAWAPAALLYLVDFTMWSAFSYRLSVWPFIAPVAVCLVLAWAFRQGRQLWRRAWLEGDAGG